MSAEPRALSFGAAAEDYEHGRPGWPPEIVERAVSVLGLGRDAVVCDLAAGTGKLTRLLTPVVGRVIAVEPDERMRDLLSRRANCDLVVEGRAEAMPLPDHSVDGVFVADAFHWFPTKEALDEIARVLRPGGGLAIFRSPWGRDRFDPPLPQALIDELQAIYDRVGNPGGPMYGEWFDLFDGSRFEQPRLEWFDWEVSLDASQVVSLWLSVSSVALLPRDDREQIRERLATHLAGTYRLVYAPELYWTRLSV